jgi:hypothetical protein
MTEPSDLKFDYLDRDEALFLMASLRGVECPNCPRFYKGCKGNHTRGDSMSAPIEDWLTRHRNGTEGHLCHKLRTLINMGEIEYQQFMASIKQDQKDRLAVIIRKNEEAVITNSVSEDTKQQIKQALADNNARWAAKMTDADKRVDDIIRKLQSESELLRTTLTLKEEQIRYYERIIMDRGGA